MEQAKARLIVDEHSVKEYFKQCANANLDDAEIRDSVLNYFVDKIYVYDDKITVTGCFSGEPTEIPFTEFSEFDCETVSPPCLTAKKAGQHPFWGPVRPFSVQVYPALLPLCGVIFPRSCCRNAGWAGSGCNDRSAR